MRKKDIAPKKIIRMRELRQDEEKASGGEAPSSSDSEEQASISGVSTRSMDKVCLASLSLWLGNCSNWATGNYIGFT